MDRPNELLGDFAQRTFSRKYAFRTDETWEQAAQRVAENVLGALGYTPRSEEVREVARLITLRKFIPGGRYLYAAGRDLHQVNNCLLLRCGDSRESWAETMWKAGMALMTGAGIGVVYSDIRPKDSPIKRTGGTASGPLAPMGIVNEIGRRVMQGGSRRSAIWAGLNWQHADVEDFIRMKDWTEDMRALKAKDWTVPMEMEMTNISVCLDDHFFEVMADPNHADHERADRIYRTVVSKMTSTGEPGFSIDLGRDSGEVLRNACTEVSSEDDSDICNLGSCNLGRIESLDELKHVIELASLFLLAGTVYSHVPYEKVSEVREKNRRLGLGLMGIHEWLLQRGKPYAPDAELGEWLECYENSTPVAANWADEHSLSTPVKTRAIAPNGTIGIVAETTTGIEPIFCAAYKRTYLEGGVRWFTEYVIDPVADRLVKQGIDPDSIEDAYQLTGSDVGRRLDFQRWVQQHVDHGISSTINLSKPMTDEDEVQDFGDMLLGYLPGLRGVTCYPDGARAGQPIVAVPFQEALEAHAMVEGNEDTCVGGVCSL